MLPPPPTRFSTTSGWPKFSASFCATSRATVSELLPAVNGTMKRIGRCGQRASAGWACAAAAERSDTRIARATRVIDRSRRSISRRSSNPHAQPRCSRDALGLALALDQRAAQQEGARQLGIFRRAAQLVVVFLAHRRILLRQQALVANSLRLRVLHGDVAALALVAVEHVVAGFAAQDLGQLL